MKDQNQILKEIKDAISASPNIFKLKKYWSRESYQNDYRLGLMSFAGEIFMEYKWESQQTLLSFINQKISVLIKAMKREDHLAWLADQAKKRAALEGKDSISKVADTHYQSPPDSGSKVKENDDAKELFNSTVRAKAACLPKTPTLPALPEQKKDNRNIQEVARHLEPLGNYFKHHPKRNKAEKLVSSISGRILKEITKTTSIYRIAKQNNVSNLRRLLYTLRTIKFPILKSKHSNGIHNYYLPLFNEIFPRVKMIWKQEDNYREWINYFRNELEWEKSRVSNFMKRRIKDKVVPDYFFDVFPAELAPNLWPSLKNKNGKLAEICKALNNMFNLNEKKIHTYRKMKKNLTNYCLGCSKTILSSL